MKAFFKKGACHKLIDYQQPIFKLSISTDIAGMGIDLKEFSKQVQEITPATNHAKSLDNYQYLLCLEIMNSTQDVEYVKTRHSPDFGSL